MKNSRMGQSTLLVEGGSERQAASTKSQERRVVYFFLYFSLYLILARVPDGNLRVVKSTFKV